MSKERENPVKNPAPNSIWQHKNGDQYQVILIANEHTERPNEYPITVVYRRLKDDKVWSRTLSRWHGSFTLISEEKQ